MKRYTKPKNMKAPKLSTRKTIVPVKNYGAIIANIGIKVTMAGDNNHKFPVENVPCKSIAA